MTTSNLDLKREADLRELRQGFDARLSPLNEPNAGERLRRVLDEPMELEDVRAGDLRPRLGPP